MRMYDIIAKKRDKNILTKEEIGFFVKGYTCGEIPDYQAAALLMAIYLNGMNDEEILFLTDEMARSGDVVDLSGIDGLTVDKHSTGGVGDKTTLIVIPTVAALGCKAAKMSGRGLGHTGGTVDKLESIPGFRAEISQKELIDIVNRIGACMVGQSGNLAPADKKLYALRDVTAAVESIPLIASSIMSKKLASGSDCIVLDVKVGSGAFMKDISKAKKLAECMVNIAANAGKKAAAILTDMDRPLGYSVGNSLEVCEAVGVLKGHEKGDLYEVSAELSTHILMLESGKDHDECRRLVDEAVSDGRAFEKLKEIVSAQGGDPSFLEDTEKFKKANFSSQIRAERSGYITHIDSEKVGTSSVVLGAGREKKSDTIDHSAGIIFRRTSGDRVEKGEVIAELFSNDKEKINEARGIFLSALEIGDERPEQLPLIFGVVCR